MLKNDLCEKLLHMMLKLLHVMLKNDLCKKIIARDAEIIAHDAKNSFIFFIKN
jgi:hypothetical protein